MLPHDISGSGPPTVLAHGFGQDRTCWGPLRGRLAERHTVITVDLPGHGAASRMRASLPAGARLLAETAGRASYVGYSMGGRHALRVAVDRPADVERLVLLSTHPGIEGRAERLARQQADETLALRIERDGVDAFVDEWTARPMFAGVPEGYRFEEVRRSADPHGLAASLRQSGTAAMPEMWSRLRNIRRPVLIVVGALDEPYLAVAERMSHLIPNVELAVVDGAGHSVHLERPDEVGAIISSFLAPLVDRGSDSTWLR